MGELSRIAASEPAHAPGDEERVPDARGGRDGSGVPAWAGLLAAPGRPLDRRTRARFEQGYGYELSTVRVHDGDVASSAARAFNADAFTVGRHIVLGDRISAGTPAFTHLIAHELAHVVQQQAASPTAAAVRSFASAQQEAEADHAAQAVMRGNGRGPLTPSAPRVARQSKQESQSATAQPPGTAFPFSVRVDAILDGDRLLIEFIKQYRRAASDTEAAALRDKEHWVWPGGPPTVTQADVDKGYVLITVKDTSIAPASKEDQQARAAYFQRLTPADQRAVNAETDQRFWARTQYSVGQKLGSSAADKRMAETWKVFRDELLRQRQAIDALPPDIRGFIFDDHAPQLEPKDFDAVLRIVSKVASLTPAELAEYKSRVTASTTDWAVYESSIDRFTQERHERDKVTEERLGIERRLYSLEELYRRYRQYRSMLVTSAVLAGGATMSPQGLGTSLGSQPTLERTRAELDADLVAAGIRGGISEFEKVIRDYARVFERETIAVARVMLDQYDHTLVVQAERYGKAGDVARLHTAVSDSGAAADYQQGDKIRAEHAQSVVFSLEEMEDQAYWVGQRNSARSRGDTKVRSAAAADPIVGAGDFDREALAGATTTADTQAQLLAYIAARRKDVAETRANLTSKPTMIYGLDVLLQSSYNAQSIEKGTIFDLIVQDHISDVHFTEAIPQLILAVIAIAAGIFTGGGGTVAVLAAGVTFGIGAAQAIDEYRRYETQSAAHGAKLTSSDPTMAWVIVAVIGAGIDLGVFVAALPKLRPAIAAFNLGPEAGNVVSLEQKLAKIADVQESVKTSIIRAAEAEAEARAAWRSVFRPPAMLRMVIIPGAEEFGRFVFAVYMSARRGIREFKLFVKANEAVDLIGDVAKLSVEEMAALKTAHAAAVVEMEGVVAHGLKLGMNENEIRAFMNLRGNTKGMGVADLTVQMDAWRTTKSSGVPFGFESAEQFGQFRETAAAELRKALKRVDPTAEAYLQGSSLSGISYKRHLPYDVASDVDVAISGRALFKKAEKLGYDVSLSPRRIGPLNPDQIAELDLRKFQRNLSESITAEGSAAPREVNIMLFENAAALRKPIGEASTEAERAAVLLKPDPVAK
ncbi:MAG: hypothetical protein JWM12_1536 [Ilumatobacteraceae bacterium]|nr:hypothetical protein [Ilumatobacteraceae bacterium]